MGISPLLLLLDDAPAATPSYEPEAQAFFARMTTPPTSDRATLYNNLIKSLKTAGVWSKLDVLYVMAAADSQAARLNLIGNTYTLMALNSPTFTVDRGYMGDGATSYLDSGYDTNNSANIKLQRNDAHLSVYVNTTTAMADIREAGSRNYAITTYGLTGGMSFRNAATNTDTTTTTFASAVGFATTSRNSASTHDTYKDGAFVQTFSRPSVVLTASTMYVGCFNNNGTAAQFSARRSACLLAGSSLTATEVTATYNAVRTYLTAVGAN